MSISEQVVAVSELIKLENIIFVLPFVYIGAMLAGKPTLVQVVLITIALASLRGAAFVANRYVGREIDRRNPDKINWPSVARYTKSSLLLLLLGFIALFAVCTYLLNILALILSPLVIFIMLIEPYTKLYTPHRHFTMGLIIGLGIFGGYIGVSGTFPTTLPIYILLIAYALFSGSNDIIHTIRYTKFDRSVGLKTYPRKYGKKKALLYSLYAHLIASILFVIFGLLIGSSVVAAAGLITALIFALEHFSADSSTQDSLANVFLYYNAAVSVLMLIAVVIFVYF